MTPPDEPTVLPLGGGQILIRGLAVIDCWRSVEAAIRLSQRRDALNPPPRLQALARALKAEAEIVSGRPRPDTRETVAPANFPQDVIFAEEAAAVLGISARQVRRIAPQLGGLRIAGRWAFDRANVAELAAERRSA